MAMGSGRKWSRWIGTCLAVGWLLAACGEPSPEAQLAKAREGLERARQEVASAEARYEEANRSLEKAEKNRNEAFEALQGARAELAEARAEVGRFATDDAIFRAVQGRLLEDDKLSEVAIPVRVNDGVVVLTGEVPDASLAQRAEKLAGEIAGVVEVRNAISVARDPAQRQETKPSGRESDEEKEKSAPDAGESSSPGGAGASEESSAQEG